MGATAAPRAPRYALRANASLEPQIQVDSVLARDPNCLAMNVTLVLPVKNEEQTIAGVLEASKPYVDHILVVDGHSTDRTRQIAAEFGSEVILDRGRGKGDAIRTAIDRSDAGVLVFMDGDGSHEPADIPRLVAPITDGQADFVLASRMTGGSDELHGDFNNFVRMIGGAFLSLCINWRWGTRITDSLNGFRAVRCDVGRTLGLTADDFDIEHEMILKVLKKGYRLIEVPSHEYQRKGGASKLPTFGRGYKFLWRLAREIW
jgi:dolichol-phosphate mannosyltransferase